jgi:hypothetical protein
LLTAVERFEQKVDRSGGPDACHPWTGALSSGYGVMTVEGKKGNVYVHRWAYEHFVGPIPEGIIVGHTCHDLDLSCRGGECPHRRCANQTHLKPMTHGDNLRAGRGAERTRERRAAIRPTHCPQGHPYAGENLYIHPLGHRCCRACGREASRRYKARQTAKARAHR